jgi:hypothetical protein
VWHIYINLIPNEKGQFEIHKANCEKLADPINRTYIGVADNHKKALSKSKKIKSNAVLCTKCWEGIT